VQEHVGEGQLSIVGNGDDLLVKVDALRIEILGQRHGERVKERSNITGALL
jgi:hypothetical protein